MTCTGLTSIYIYIYQIIFTFLQTDHIRSFGAYLQQTKQAQSVLDPTHRNVLPPCSPSRLHASGFPHVTRDLALVPLRPVQLENTSSQTVTAGRVVLFVAFWCIFFSVLGSPGCKMHRPFEGRKNPHHIIPSFRERSHILFPRQTQI